MLQNIKFVVNTEIALNTSIFVRVYSTLTFLRCNKAGDFCSSSGCAPWNSPYVTTTTRCPENVKESQTVQLSAFIPTKPNSREPSNDGDFPDSAPPPAFGGTGGQVGNTYVFSATALGGKKLA